jgi:outer membrane immunogenic protein
MSMEDFMRSKFWCGIGLLAFITAGTASADAADLARKAPPQVAAPVYLSDWAGFYIGINGGYGWGDTSVDAPFGALGAKPKGGVFGGHAGYNWQYQSVVGGLEVDFSGADIHQSSSITGVRLNGLPIITRDVKIDELASARGRLGYALFPGILAYGTAGIGWGHSRLDVATATTSDSTNTNQFGWVAGAGLEYKLIEHLLLRAEYLHYDFAKTSVNNANVTDKVDVVRGGLSYKF